MPSRVRVKLKSSDSLSRIAKSGELAARLEPLANEVLAAAQQDPNKAYVATLRKRLFVSSGRSGRVSWQIGAAPWGVAVEAVRGTMARALGRVG